MDRATLFPAMPRGKDKTQWAQAEAQQIAFLNETSTEKVTEHQKGLPGEVEETPCLEIFSTQPTKLILL